ncbi:MAG: ABC transporter permease subunit [Rhodospirillales bacterium]|nr:ABC transporter permease subunit [Rhodospirillales bacterium]
MTRLARALAMPVLLLLAAEIAMRLGGGASDALAPPSAVARALAVALVDGTLLAASAATLAAAVGGLLIGGGVGLLLGLLFGAVPALARLFSIAVEAVRPIPAVALIPLALILFGFGYRLEIAIVAFAAIWPMLVFTQSAVAGVEPRLLEVARALRLPLAARLLKIVIPFALPRIFVAFRLSAGIALIVAVTVEIAVNPLGLGYGMTMAQQTLRPAEMLAYLVWIGVVGWLLNRALLAVQRHAFARFTP